MRVSVVILNWNTKRLLRRCLKSLNSKLKTQNSKLEVIVVDNGSTDGSQEYLKTQTLPAGRQASKLKSKSQNLKLKIILNPENRGFARGSNQGIKAAKGDLIILLNADTIVPSRTIEKLAVYLWKSPDLAAVSPLLLLPDGRPQIDYYLKFPNLWQIFLYHHPLWRPLIMKTPLRRLIVNEAKRGPFEVDQLPGAALMAKKEAWKKVGLLDEDYQLFYEDVDWCWRAKRKGYRLMVVPEAQIVHFGGASWKQKLKADRFRFYRQFFASLLLFVGKNYGYWQERVFRAALVFHFLLTLKWRLALHFLKTRRRQGRLWS